MALETDSCDESLKILSQDTYAQLFDCLRQDSGGAEYTKIIDHPGTYIYSDSNEDSTTKCEVSFDTFVPKKLLQEQQNLLSLQSTQSNLQQFSSFGGQVPEDVTFTDSGAPLQRPPTSLSPSPMSMIPSHQAFGGAYKFQFEFGKQPKDTKSAAWTYSSITNKLYAQKDLSCPIRFKINADGVAHRLFIRALPVYSKPEYLQEVVKRCPNHIQAPESANIPHREHFIWCENQGANYVKDPHSGRTAVVIPYDAPPAGTPWVTYLFSFKCLNSCTGGPNRRELSIIYTLENAHQEVLGRTTIDLRICACPGRDRKTDESKTEGQRNPQIPVASNSSSGTTVTPTVVSPPQHPHSGSQLVHQREFTAMTKRARHELPSEVFTLSVRGQRNFEILTKIRDSLEMTDQLVPHNERDRYTEQRRQNDAQFQPPPPQQRPALQHYPAPVVAQQTHRLPTMGSAFNFSSARFNIKQDVVDSTQRGCDMVDNAPAHAGRGYDMTDSSSASPTVTQWLKNLGLSAYSDNFHSAGLHSMDQLKSEQNFTIKDLESMKLTKPTVLLIWKSLKEFRRSVNPAANRESTNAETVSLPDSQGGSPPSSQELLQSQNSVISLGSSSAFSPSMLEFTRCSIKLTVTSKNNNNKRPAESLSDPETMDREEYTSKKHKALKKEHNSQ